MSGIPLIGMADRLYERHTAESKWFDIFCDVVFWSGEQLEDQTETYSNTDR